MPTQADIRLASSYAACERMAREHYENFPVASRLLPRPLRRHVAAVYAFARTADDIADEPGRQPDERLRLLHEWRQHLHAAPAFAKAPVGRPDVAEASAGTPSIPDLVFPALHDTIARFDLPIALLDDLVCAFEQDVTQVRYDTWEALLDYCRRSANPVGRIVLRLSGRRDDELDLQSDAVCTALQLTNFWQDLAVDWSRGRLYVPAEIWRASGADPADLDRGTWTPQWTRALQECGARTRVRFREGRAVCDGVRGRLRYELRATWLGGTRMLDALDDRAFDVFAHRPRLGVLDAVVIACRTLAWARTR